MEITEIVSAHFSLKNVAVAEAIAFKSADILSRTERLNRL